MEKKHDLIFCAQCGVKLDGDEVICSVCGYKLAELHPVKNQEQPIVHTPPQVETPVMPPTIKDNAQTPPSTENDGTLCPSCGAKIDGLELFCNRCGFRLSEKPTISKVETPMAPPSVVETPKVPPIVVPPPVVETPVAPLAPPAPPKVEPTIRQQQQTNISAQPAKKGMSAIWWILIILFTVIILGGGTAAFIQYNGIADIPVLNNIIPAENNSSTTVIANSTNYYVLHSFAIIGKEWTAAVSEVIVSSDPSESENGIKNRYKKALMQQMPKDYQHFTSTILVNKYTDYSLAVSGRNNILRDYGNGSKKHNIRSIKFN